MANVRSISDLNVPDDFDADFEEVFSDEEKASQEKQAAERIAALEAKIALLETENTKLKTENAEVISAAKLTTQELASVVAVKVEIEEKLSAEQALRIFNRDYVLALGKEISSFKDKLHQSEAEILTLDEEISDNRRLRHQSKKEILALGKEISGHRENIRELKVEVLALKSQKSTLSANYRFQKEKQDQELEFLQAMLASTIETKTKLEAELKSLNLEQEFTLDSNEILRNALDARDSEVRQLTHDLAESERNIEKLSNALMLSVDWLVSELFARKRAERNSGQLMSLLMTGLSSAGQEIANLKTELESAEELLAIAIEQNGRLRAKSKEDSTEVTRLQVENTTLSSELDASNAVIDQLQEIVEQKAEDLADLSKQRDESRRFVTSFANEMTTTILTLLHDERAHKDNLKLAQNMFALSQQKLQESQTRVQQLEREKTILSKLPGAEQTIEKVNLHTKLRDKISAKTADRTGMIAKPNVLNQEIVNTAFLRIGGKFATPSAPSAAPQTPELEVSAPKSVSGRRL